MRTLTTLTAQVLKLDVPTGNNRTYTTQDMVRCITEAQGKVMHGQIGMQDRGLVVDLEQVSHTATNLRIVDGYVVADIEVVDTAAGRTLENMLDQFEFRTNGIGMVNQYGIVDDYNLITINAVPAGTGA